MWSERKREREFYLLDIDTFSRIIRACDDINSSWKIYNVQPQDIVLGKNRWDQNGFFNGHSTIPSRVIFVSLGINVSTVISCKTCLENEYIKQNPLADALMVTLHCNKKDSLSYSHVSYLPLLISSKSSAVKFGLT